MRTKEPSFEPGRKRFKFGVIPNPCDCVANKKDASGRGREGKASQIQIIRDDYEQMLYILQENSLNKKGTLTITYESEERSKNSSSDKNVERYDKGRKGENEVAPSNDLHERNNVGSQRNNKVVDKCATPNSNTLNSTTAVNNKVNNNISSRVAHENDSNNKKKSRVIGRRCQVESDSTNVNGFSSFNNASVFRNNYLAKHKLRRHKYLPHKKGGGEYVDVEASNLWRMMCPAFDTSRCDKSETSLHLQCRDII